MKHGRSVMKYTLPLWLLGLCLLGACSRFGAKGNNEREAYSERRCQMEDAAQGMLAAARAQLAAARCDSARTLIEQMRKQCYLALTARRQGILLMDSIDMAEARAELVRVDSAIHAGCDTLGQADFDDACRKVEFYERKLKHDQSNP